MKRLQVTEPAGWHVFARGTRRLVLFREEQDYEVFLAYLRQAILLAGCSLWAYALMSNHYHLALRATSEQLSVCMHHLNRLYARYHNRKYGLTGHAFDAPYQAYRQGTFLLLLRTIAYIFLNPVTAGLADHPRDYRWSGYRSLLREGRSPLPVDLAGLLQVSGMDESAFRRRFAWTMELESRRLERKPQDRLTASKVQQHHFAWLLDEARAHADRFPGEDPVTVALYWGFLCGIRPGAAAAVLGQRGSAALRNRLLRLRKRVAMDEALRSRLQLP